MTHKEIAQRLREIYKNNSLVQMPVPILELANELDPQRPEPGTVVWWAHANDTGRWFLGYALYDQRILSLNHPDSVRDGYAPEYDDVQWKPARILAPDEVAVKVPPVSEWGSSTHQFAIDGYELGSPRSHRLRTITRAEAMRMEADR